MTALKVKTSAELQEALDKATAGTSIVLLPKEYVGNFVISRSGQEENIIDIRGTSVIENNKLKGTVISSNGSGVIFDVNADFVKISNMNITNAEVGIQIKGSNNVATSLTLYEVKKGVILNGDLNEVMSSTIESLDTGVPITGNKNTISDSTIIKGNNGVIINGFGNAVRSCTIKKTADTGLVIEKGTATDIKSCTLSSLKVTADSSDGVIASTTLKGPLDLQGSKFVIKSVSSKTDVNIQGRDNAIENAFFTGSNVSIACN